MSKLSGVIDMNAYKKTIRCRTGKLAKKIIYAGLLPDIHRNITNVNGT
jgi:hypothetical protein